MGKMLLHDTKHLSETRDFLIEMLARSRVIVDSVFVCVSDGFQMISKKYLILSVCS
jgi:hypothetical protein